MRFIKPYRKFLESLFDNEEEKEVSLNDNEVKVEPEESMEVLSTPEEEIVRSKLSTDTL